MTNLATYLDEQFVGVNNAGGADAILYLNWSAGSTTTYMYEYVSSAGDTNVDAAELTYLGSIERGTTILTTGDSIDA